MGSTDETMGSLLRGIAVGIALYLLWPQLGAALGLDHEVWRYAVAAVAGLLIFLGSRHGFRGGPRVGEFWMAQVPFAEGGGSKDRPCLVVGRRTVTTSVLYITSQNKSDDGSYIRIDNSNWSGDVGKKGSWMRVAQRNGSDPRITVGRRGFRRKLGRISKSDRAALTNAGLLTR